MKWIILIGDEKFELDSLRYIEYTGDNKVSDIDSEKFIVDYGKDYVSFEYANDIIEDYEVDELKNLPFKTLHFIMMTYSSKELMEEIISQDNFVKNVYVDEDKVDGTLISINEFVMNIKSKAIVYDKDK